MFLKAQDCNLYLIYAELSTNFKFKIERKRKCALISSKIIHVSNVKICSKGKKITPEIVQRELGPRNCLNESLGNMAGARKRR